MLITKYKTQKEKINFKQERFSEIWIGGYSLSIIREAARSYDFKDPKEKIRVKYYYELIEKYGYPPEKIEFDVRIPPEIFEYADIVIYKDEERKIPYIVIELKGIGSKDEFEKSVKKAVFKAKILNASFAVCVSRSRQKVIAINYCDKGRTQETAISSVPFFE